MGWSVLGSQFCLELGFGVLVALAFVPRAPVGTLFYRIMGTCAFLPLGVALLASLAWGGASATDPATLAITAAIAGYPVVSGPFKGRRWAFFLATSLLGSGAALVMTVAAGASSLEGPVEILLGSMTAMATGVVAGSVSLAMVLGHWYLTIPTLDVAHLRRLNRVTALSMLACIALLAATCVAFHGRLSAADTPLFGPRGMFHLGTRLAVGLALPLAFAWMTAGSLDFRNTRSATGILYASTILVLIGTAVSVSLQGSYGIPL
jgi:hypothetical protein